MNLKTKASHKHSNLQIIFKPSDSGTVLTLIDADINADSDGNMSASMFKTSFQNDNDDKNKAQKVNI